MAAIRQAGTIGWNLKRDNNQGSRQSRSSLINSGARKVSTPNTRGGTKQNSEWAGLTPFARARGMIVRGSGSHPICGSQESRVLYILAVVLVAAWAGIGAVLLVLLGLRT